MNQTTKITLYTHKKNKYKTIIFNSDKPKFNDTESIIRTKKTFNINVNEAIDIKYQDDFYYYFLDDELADELMEDYKNIRGFKKMKRFDRDSIEIEEPEPEPEPKPKPKKKLKVVKPEPEPEPEDEDEDTKELKEIYERADRDIKTFIDSIQIDITPDIFNKIYEPEPEPDSKIDIAKQRYDSYISTKDILQNLDDFFSPRNMIPDQFNDFGDPVNYGGCGNDINECCYLNSYTEVFTAVDMIKFMNTTKNNIFLDEFKKTHKPELFRDIVRYNKLMIPNLDNEHKKLFMFKDINDITPKYTYTPEQVIEFSKMLLERTEEYIYNAQKPQIY